AKYQTRYRSWSWRQENIFTPVHHFDHGSGCPGGRNIGLLLNFNVAKGYRAAAAIALHGVLGGVSGCDVDGGVGVGAIVAAVVIDASRGHLFTMICSSCSSGAVDTKRTLSLPCFRCKTIESWTREDTISSGPTCRRPSSTPRHGMVLRLL
ncbi:unnamed protein product, partial [Scytosiphon promiscuus]